MSLALSGQSPYFVDLVSFFFLNFQKLVFQLLNSVFVKVNLISHAALVVIQFVQGRGPELDVSLQVGASALVQVKFFTKLEDLFLLISSFGL